MSATFFNSERILELSISMPGLIQEAAVAWDERLRTFRGWVPTDWGGFYNPAKAIYPTRLIEGYIMANHLIQVLAREGLIIVLDEKRRLKEELCRFDDEFNDHTFWYWVGRIKESLSEYSLPKPPALPYQDLSPDETGIAATFVAQELVPV